MQVYPLYLVASTLDIPELKVENRDFLVTRELLDIILSKITITTEQNFTTLKFNANQIIYANNSYNVSGRLHIWKIESAKDLFSVISLHYLVFHVPRSDIREFIEKIFYLEPWEIV